MERELAEGLVVTGTSDEVDEKLAEVLCETWKVVVWLLESWVIVVRKT